MSAEPTPLDRVLPYLAGTVLVVDQPERRRFVVWRGGDDVFVLDRSSGVLIDRWPVESDPVPTVETVSALVEYRSRQGY